MKAFRPMLFLAAILLIIGLACSAVGGGGDTPSQPVATQEEVQVNTPTTAPEPTTVPPTEVEPPTEAPTEAAPEAMDFFTEEFEDSYAPDSWQTFTSITCTLSIHMKTSQSH